MEIKDLHWKTRPALYAGLILFLAAFALRVLFWQATPMEGRAYSPFYKGDAPTWLAYAESIQHSQPFEFGLPLRPPGVAYFLALVWNGRESGLWTLRLIWCFLGAGVVTMVFVAALRSFGLRTAAIAGLAATASTGLMTLSSSVNNETPYLLIVAAVFAVWESLRRRPRTAPLAAFAALNALACLVRVEHALFFALASVWLAWLWRRDEGWRPSLARTCLVLAVFAAALTPWHLKSWAAIERFNDQPLPTSAARDQMLQRLEEALSPITWTPDAQRERDRLPAFCRRNMSNFVAATVALRGGAQVTAEDLSIIDQAFGSRPGKLDPHPFLVLYGDLNFHLANNAEATGGFNRAPLEAPPPLAGGEARYPRALIQGLPPPQLALSYPPHLQILNHGYRLGFRWIRAHPADFLGLAWKKLVRFWRGASLGFTGYGLPLGLSGEREVVDLTVAETGWAATVWRLAMLVVLIFGLWFGRGPGLAPWVLFLATKVIVTLAFFGYAREGATVIPVLALAIGLTAVRGTQRGLSPESAGRWLAAFLLAAAALAAVEGVRFVQRPQVTLDDRPVWTSDPFPADEYKARRVRVGF